MSLDAPSRPAADRDDTPRHLRARTATNDPHRPLPASIEAEQGVISSYLIEPRLVGAKCAERRLGPAHFHIPAHATIHGVMVEMWSVGKPIDIVTLTQVLHDRNLLETCGGAGMVAGLFTFLPTAANVEYYLETLEEKRVLRELIRECSQLAERAYSEQDDVPGLVSTLSGLSGRIAGGERKAAPTMRELVMAKMERMAGTSQLSGVVPTGIAKLDVESPLRLGSMPLLCGQQKTGKSMVALCIALHAAMAGHRGLYFSLEDPAENVLDRMSANVSGIPAAKHCNDTMGEVDFQDMTRALDRLRDLPFQIRDDLHDLGAIAGAIEQEKAINDDLELVVLDYAQLVRAETRSKKDLREQEVAMVSRTLRLMSIRLNLAIILLSQVNEDGQSRESRSLEQDCTAKWMIEHADNQNVRLFRIPFQRNAASAVKFRLTFHGHLARVLNYAGPDTEDAPPQPKKAYKAGHRAFGGY